MVARYRRMKLFHASLVDCDEFMVNANRIHTWRPDAGGCADQDLSFPVSKAALAGNPRADHASERAPEDASKGSVPKPDFRNLFKRSSSLNDGDVPIPVARLGSFTSMLSHRINHPRYCVPSTRFARLTKCPPRRIITEFVKYFPKHH